MPSVMRPDTSLSSDAVASAAPSTAPMKVRGACRTSAGTSATADRSSRCRRRSSSDTTPNQTTSAGAYSSSSPPGRFFFAARSPRARPKRRPRRRPRACSSSARRRRRRRVDGERARRGSSAPPPRRPRATFPAPLQLLDAGDAHLLRASRRTSSSSRLRFCPTPGTSSSAERSVRRRRSFLWKVTAKRCASSRMRVSRNISAEFGLQLHRILGVHAEDAIGLLLAALRPRAPWRARRRPCRSCRGRSARRAAPPPRCRAAPCRRR